MTDEDFGDDEVERITGGDADIEKTSGSDEEVPNGNAEGLSANN